jgi:peptide chain release factor 2
MELLEDDPGYLEEATSIAENLSANLVIIETQGLLSGELDSNDAVLTINAGAGGTESCDWASMLLRMYLRFAEKKQWKTEIHDYQDGEEAGVKSVSVGISGEYAYGLLKAESGVHRLVRISPFDSNARRHTSFASVFVTAVVDESVEIEIIDTDLRIDTYRASGAGGQHVNRTDSAVRMTHLPSGIVVQCQSQRSQHQNREKAMEMLRAKLYEKEMEERRAKQANIEAGKAEIGWSSQMRSYVLHPYKLIKDHRTDHESTDPDRVLDGDLDDFISEYLSFVAN